MRTGKDNEMSLRLGIDAGGTTIKLGLVNAGHEITHALDIPTAFDFEEAARDIAAAVRSLADKAGISLVDLPYIGIGVPSTVRPDTGRVVLANNTGWEDAPMKERLEELLGRPVRIANDADCALAAEAAAGAARGQNNVLMVTLGTGVGGAMLMGGRLFSGCDGMGMEVGHTPLFADGRPCTCGAAGCLEAYASATGLIALACEQAQQHMGSALYTQTLTGQLDGKAIFDAAQAGDDTALLVVDTYTAWLAQGLGGLINIFRPDLILLGGGISHAGDLLFDRVRALLPRFILAHDVIGGPQVVPALLGNPAGIIGAAFLQEVQGG